MNINHQKEWHHNALESTPWTTPVASGRFRVTLCLPKHVRGCQLPLLQSMPLLMHRSGHDRGSQLTSPSSGIAPHPACLGSSHRRTPCEHGAREQSRAAWDCREPPEAGQGLATPPPVLTGDRPCHTSISDIQPPEHEAGNFGCFRPLSLWCFVTAKLGTERCL